MTLIVVQLRKRGRGSLRGKRAPQVQEKVEPYVSKKGKETTTSSTAEITGLERLNGKADKEKERRRHRKDPENSREDDDDKREVQTQSQSTP